MSSDFAFFTPLTERTPLPLWFLPSFLLVGTLSMLVSPKYRALRLAVGGTVLAALVYHTPRYTTGGVNSDFVVGLFVSGISLKFWEFLYYRHAEEYAWRAPSLNPRLTPVKHNGSVTVNGNGTVNGGVASNGSTVTNGTSSIDGKVNGEAKQPGADVHVHGDFDSTWEKFLWSLSLWTTTRGVEWNWGIKDLMPVAPDNLTRLNFCRHSIYKLSFSLVSIDFIRAIVLTTPFGNPETYKFVSILTQPFFPRMVISWLIGLQIYNALMVPYYAFATLTTAFGICRPEQWPPIYGNFRKHCYRVRNLWGKCWHLQIRRSITSPSTAIITKLGLKRGSNASKYANLWIAFFFSSMCHTFAQYLITRSEGGNVLNWMSQAAAITFEDFAIAWAQHRGIQDSAGTRAFGFLWVIFWLSLHPSLPLGANTVLQAGGGYDPAGAIEPSAFFPLRKGSDTLLKVVMDYGVSWYCVQRGLTLINARNGDDIATALQGIVGAIALYFAR